MLTAHTLTSDQGIMCIAQLLCHELPCAVAQGDAFECQPLMAHTEVMAECDLDVSSCLISSKGPCRS